MADIITAALAAAGIAKTLVDIVKATDKAPSWVLPLLALVFGILATILLVVSTGTLLTPQTTAQAVLAGILAGGSAVGITSVHNFARRDEITTP